MKTIIGIDISAVTFDAGYVVNEVRYHHVFSNNGRGFKALVAWTQHLPGELIFSMEATGDYSYDLASFLFDRGFAVFVNNPRLVKWFAKADNHDDKTDKLDAFVNMRYCESKLAKLRPWKPLPQPVLYLRELTRERAKLVALRESCGLRLRRSKNPLIRAHQHSLLKESRAQVERLDKEIRSFIASHDDLSRQAKLLLSIKGIGMVTAAAFLSEVPWFAEFRNKADLVRFAGLNPVARESGTSLHGTRFISKKGNARLRKAFYMPALVAAKHNSRCAHKYQSLLARGKKPKQALIAVMRQLLCIAFGVLTTGSPAYTAQEARKTA